MPNILLRYELDITGTNPDNLVRGEAHTLSDLRFRALAPLHGAFYTKGCVLTDLADGRILHVDVDYSFTYLYSSASVMYGKEVVGAVIITNPDVSSNVSITYQVLGGHYSNNIDALVGMLETDIGDLTSDDYIDIINRPRSFMPSPHVHDLGDGIGFEYLIFALDKLAATIAWTDAGALMSLIERIDEFLASQVEKMEFYLDSNMLDLMREFKKNFTKQALGLDKLVNMPATTEADGAFAANDNFNMGGEINNRYVTLSALVSFKEAMISRMVSSERTNLGKQYGVIMIPTMVSIESTVNGTVVIVDSIENTVLSKIIYDESVFPDLADRTSRWAIRRVTNNMGNRGGTFTAHSMSTGAFYTGVLTINNNTRSFKWTKMFTTLEADALLKRISDHITNTNNPHQLRADQVGMGNLENLPVASLMTILARVPVREYVTYDALLLFMRAFMTNNWQIDPGNTDDPENQKNNIIRYTTMFSPCGASACDSQLVLDGPTATPAPSIPVRDIMVGWSCNLYTKRVQYTDGKGGYYFKEEENSVDCGFKPPSASFAIRDMNSTLLGYGFPPTGDKDALATVRVDDARGIATCYIFPVAGTGRSTEIRNAAGETLGFAVNP